MTQIAIHPHPWPEGSTLSLELGSALRLSDDELFELCQRNRELRIERSACGDLEIMTPVGGESSVRNARLVRLLGNWAEEDGRGVVFDSSGGFILGNGAMRSPDAAWVLRERLVEIPAAARRKFLTLCPDFVVELVSPSDDLPKLRRKMDEYLANGARLGWLIDPDCRRVEIYRPGRPAERLESPETVAGDPELPGFVLELGPLWEAI